MRTDDKQPPDHYAFSFPCKRAAVLVFTALAVPGRNPEDAPVYDATGRTACLG